MNSLPLPAPAEPGLAPASHLVGRERELAEVQNLLHDAALGAGSTTLFGARSGVGKSRFLSECAVIDPAALVLRARCGEKAATGSNALGDLVEALHAPDASLAALPPSARAAKRKPILVLVDDVQRADDEGVRLLDALASIARARCVVVVGTLCEAMSPAPAASARANYWIGKGWTYRALAPLDDAAMEVLVRSLARPNALAFAAEELREVVQTAQGNARFAVEMVAAGPTVPGRPLIPAGAIEAAGEIRRAVSDAEFETLTLACAIGNAFRDEWLVVIAQQPPAVIASELQRMADLGVLVENPTVPGWFSFREVAVRKALYGSIVSLRRRVLHERIVAYLSRLEGDSAHTALVAEHWHLLADHAHAADWLTRAAGEFAAASRFGVAAELYGRAATHLSPGSAQWLDVQRQILRCYRNAGEVMRMVPVAKATIAAIQQTSAPTTIEPFLWDLFYAYLNNGDRPAARAVAAEIAALPQTQNPNAREIVQLILAYALGYDGKRSEASALIAPIDLQTLVDDEARLRYFVTIATIDAIHGPLEHSLDLIDRAVALARPLGVRGTTHAFMAGSEIAARYGDLPTAARYLDDARATAARSAGEINDVKRRVAQEQIRGIFLAGNLGAAREHVRETLPFRHAGRHNESFQAGIGVAVGMRAGDLALVDALFEPELLYAAVRTSDAESCGILILGFSEVMQLRGLAKELKRALEECLTKALIDPYAWIQLTAARLGSDECAALAVEHMDVHFRTATAPAPAAHCALFDAIMAHRRGKHVAACEFARDAAGRYGRVGWRLFEAFALELAGDVEAARVAYGRCGATADAARLALGQTRKLRRAPFGARLTARELQVTRLLARNRSDAEIARALGLSVRTVHHHVEAAFSKLGVRARWQVTPAMLEAGLRPGGQTPHAGEGLHDAAR